MHMGIAVDRLNVLVSFCCFAKTYYKVWLCDPVSSCLYILIVTAPWPSWIFYPWEPLFSGFFTCSLSACRLVFMFVLLHTFCTHAFRFTCMQDCFACMVVYLFLHIHACCMLAGLHGCICAPVHTSTFPLNISVFRHVCLSSFQYCIAKNFVSSVLFVQGYISTCFLKRIYFTHAKV